MKLFNPRRLKYVYLTSLKQRYHTQKKFPIGPYKQEMTSP